MIASYTCELCYSEFEDEDEFVRCKGDACNEDVCKECAKKCKDPTCKNMVCERCLEDNSELCGEYCIHCAMFDEDSNFDYIEHGMTHAQGYAHLKELEKKLAKE